MKDSGLIWRRVQARTRLALFVTNPLARVALEVAAPGVVEDIRTVLQDLTERDTGRRLPDDHEED